MALVVYFNFELHQMDVKTVFRNERFFEETYMSQPEGFEVEGKNHMVCKLEKDLAIISNKPLDHGF